MRALDEQGMSGHESDWNELDIIVEIGGIAIDERTTWLLDGHSYA